MSEGTIIQLAEPDLHIALVKRGGKIFCQAFRVWPDGRQEQVSTTMGAQIMAEFLASLSCAMLAAQEEAQLAQQVLQQVGNQAVRN